MSAAHAAELQATGRVAATTETFISRTQAFSEAYEGVLVQFRMQAGTTEQLAAIGVRDASALSSATYPGMPLVGRGWTAGNAFFKAEGAQINIGLGRGAALDVFNSNIAGFNVIRW